MRLPTLLACASCLTLTILACSSESDPTPAGTGPDAATTPSSEAGTDGSAPGTDAGSDASSKLAPGTAQSAFTFKSSTGNADATPFSSASGLVVASGALLDIGMTSGTRFFDLLVTTPVTVGERDLDGGKNGLTYTQNGNKQSWMTKEAAIGKLKITRVDAGSFAFTIEARMVPTGYVGSDSTGDIDVIGSGEATIP